METCNSCKKDITVFDHGGTGYGLDADSNKICYACCAENDKEYMRTHDKITLYLVEKGASREVTNWPGTMRLKVTDYSKGRHNMAGTQYRVRFIGPDAKIWSGVQYGDNTQIVHCKRMVNQPKK